MLLISLATLFISLLNPSIGYVFAIAIGGRDKLVQQQQRAVFCGIVAAGLVFFFLLKTITFLEIADVLGSVLLVSWIYMTVLDRTKDHSKAMFLACFSQIVYGILRTFMFGGIYRERIEVIFSGYESLLMASGSQSVLENIGNGQLELMLEHIKTILIDYQMAIWTIMMLFAVYLGTLFLSKRIFVNWQHRFLKLPFATVYLFAGALFLAVLPASRLLGMNLVLVFLTLQLFQGLAIIDFWCKKHLKRSRFVMFAIVFLMFVNIFFAIIVSMLGMIDNWLDIRKINHI